MISSTRPYSLAPFRSLGEARSTVRVKITFPDSRARTYSNLETVVVAMLVGVVVSKVYQILCPLYVQMGTFLYSQPHVAGSIKSFCFSSTVENVRVVLTGAPALVARGGREFESLRRAVRPSQFAFWVPEAIIATHTQKLGKDLGKITAENQLIPCTQVRLSTKRTNQMTFPS